MTYLVISLGRWSVKADRYAVKGATKGGRSIVSVIERGVSVGVDAHRKRALLFYSESNVSYDVESYRGLTVAAEDDLTVSGKITCKYRVDDLLLGRLTLEP